MLGDLESEMLAEGDLKGIAYSNERVTNERSYFQMKMKEGTHWIILKENRTQGASFSSSKGGGTVDGKPQGQEHPRLHHEFKPTWTRQ